MSLLCPEYEGVCGRWVSGISTGLLWTCLCARNWASCVGCDVLCVYLGSLSAATLMALELAAQ